MHEDQRRGYRHHRATRYAPNHGCDPDTLDHWRSSVALWRQRHRHTDIGQLLLRHSGGGRDDHGDQGQGHLQEPERGHVRHGDPTTSRLRGCTNKYGPFILCTWAAIPAKTTIPNLSHRNRRLWAVLTVTPVQRDMGLILALRRQTLYPAELRAPRCEWSSTISNIARFEAERKCLLPSRGGHCHGALEALHHRRESREIERLRAVR